MFQHYLVGVSKLTCTRAPRFNSLCSVTQLRPAMTFLLMTRTERHSSRITYHVWVYLKDSQTIIRDQFAQSRRLRRKKGAPGEEDPLCGRHRPESWWNAADKKAGVQCFCADLSGSVIAIRYVACRRWLYSVVLPPPTLGTPTQPPPPVPQRDCLPFEYQVSDFFRSWRRPPIFVRGNAMYFFFTSAYYLKNQECRGFFIEK